MQLYKNNPDGYYALRKQVLSKTISIMAVVLVTVLAIFYFSQDWGTADLKAVLTSVGVMVLVLAFSIYRGITQQKIVFNSFELTIGSNYLLRKQLGLGSKTIPFEEISTITETGKGFLEVIGLKKDDSIFITPYLDGYDSVKSFLEGLKPIALQQKKSILAKYPLLPVLAVGALMVAVYTSANKIVVGLSGTLLIGLLVWSFFKTRASSLIDARTKKYIWMVWMVIASVALILYFKVFGGL
jgi:hypothetical protein